MIKNFNSLANTEVKKKALKILEVGLVEYSLRATVKKQLMTLTQIGLMFWFVPIKY